MQPTSSWLEGERRTESRGTWAPLWDGSGLSREKTSNLLGTADPERRARYCLLLLHLLCCLCRGCARPCRARDRRGTVLPPCHRPHGGMLWGLAAGQDRVGGFIPYVEHAVRRCFWADLGNGWLLHHCRLVQAYASGQLLWGFLLLSVHLGLGVFFWESRCMEVMPLRCGADCTWHSRCEASLLFVVIPNCSGSEIHFFLRCGNLKGCERLALGLTGWWDCS